MKTLLVSFFIFFAYGDNSPISAKRLDILSGAGEQKFDPKVEWNKKYNRSSFVYGKLPAKFLAENSDYIPDGSRILDMGMGEGRNSVYLAQKGHQVVGVDISTIAIRKARKLAKEFDVKMKFISNSMDKVQFEAESFDVILAYYYVDRSLLEKIYTWLKPGGLVFYEAYTTKEYDKKVGTLEPKSYYLKPQELLSMFKNYQILKFEEPEHEDKYRSSVIARKRISKKPKGN